MTTMQEIELLTILQGKKFKSLPACADYLYLAGYSIFNAYTISKTLFLPIIHIESDYNKHLKPEQEVLNLINNCEIEIASPTIIKSDVNFKTHGLSLLYGKNNQYFFNQYFESKTFYVDYNTPMEADIYINHLLEQYLGLSGYSVKRSLA